MNAISNADIIDSRDVINRIVELENMQLDEVVDPPVCFGDAEQEMMKVTIKTGVGAGISLSENISGVGMSAVRSALRAIGMFLGFEFVLICEH